MPLYNTLPVEYCCPQHSEDFSIKCLPVLVKEKARNLQWPRENIIFSLVWIFKYISNVKVILPNP